MMLVLAILAVSLQNAPTTDRALTSLAGKWISTVQVPRGEAPAISPSFTVEVKGDTAIVVLEGGKERYAATPYDGEKGQCFLVLTTPDLRGGSRLVIVRTLEPGRVRFEVFVQRTRAGKSMNFYYAEVFKKVS